MPEQLPKLISEFTSWLKDWSVMLGLFAAAVSAIAIFSWNNTIGRLASKSSVSRDILLSVKKAEDELRHTVELFNKNKIQTDKDILASIHKAESELQKCYADVQDALLQHEERETARSDIAAKENREEHGRIIDILLSWKEKDK